MPKSRFALACRPSPARRAPAVVLAAAALICSYPAAAAADPGTEPTACRTALPPGLSYPQAIQTSIERCLFLAPGIQGNPRCEVEFDQSEQGVVSAVRMLKCDLAPPEFGHHVMRAIRKASPLPLPVDGQPVPRTVRVVFRPDMERIREAQKRYTAEYHTEMPGLMKQNSEAAQNAFKERQRIAEAELAAKLDGLMREYPGSRVVRSPEKEFLFASYYKQAAEAMKPVTQQAYREEAKGKFGGCQATITLSSDGNLLEYGVHRCGPSEQALAAATRKIIERSAFPPFPPEIASRHGVLHLLASFQYDLPEPEAPPRSMIGITMLPVTAELARALGWPEPQGVVISEVQPGGPADEAGIRRGDVILESSSTPVFSPAEILRQLADFRPGSTIHLKVWRQGKTQVLQVVLRELKADVAAARSPGPLPNPTWMEQIREKIRFNLTLPQDTPAAARAVFSVVQLPDGKILSISLKSSSGHLPYDRAVERAIQNSSPLPKAPTAQEFRRNLELAVSP